MVCGGGVNGMPGIDICEVVSQSTPGGSSARAGASARRTSELATARRAVNAMFIRLPILD
jgi:hypothetical protein